MELGSVWLSQKMMAGLFGVDVRTVNEHLQNIFKTAELSQNTVIRKYRITAKDGKKYNTQFYNLDAIISVGYRTKPAVATHFRLWATKALQTAVSTGQVNQAASPNVDADSDDLAYNQEDTSTEEYVEL